MKKVLLAFIPLLAISSILANPFHNYFWAKYQQFGGNTQETKKWYNHIFSDANHSLLNNKGYLHFLADTKDYKKIVELMPKLEKTFAKDPDVQLTFVTALRNVGKKDEADKRIIELSQAFKDHTEIVFNAAETLVQRKEHKNALVLLDTYLNNAPRRPNNFIFYFLKGQIYMQLKEFKHARAFLQQCLEAHPRFPQGWLLKAMLEEQAGQLDQAMQGFSSYLELTGPNKQIEQHLMQLAIKQKASQKNGNVVVLNRPCIEKAVLLFEKKQYRAALQQIDACLASNETDPQMRLLKVQILAAMHEYTDAIKNLVSWSAADPNNLMWPQVLHLLSRAKAPIEKIINAFTVLQSRQPNSLVLNLYLADLYSRADNGKSALQYNRKALALTNDPRIKTRVLFQIATLEYEQSEYAQMLKTLAILETINSQFAPALNLHAYYLATYGNNLSKADELFKKAYALDTGNPHILDTKGVILYKQKKYAQALKLLKPLSEKMPDDSSVHIHLAKTYAKLNNLTDARTTIERAQQAARTPYEHKTCATLAQQWKKA